MKKILKLILLLLLSAVALLMIVFYRKANSDPYPPEVNVDSVPKFKSVAFPFEHRYASSSLPFLGSAVFDADGDGVPEVFIGGGADQQDALFAFKGGAFVDISANRGFAKPAGDPTYGAASIDANGDGTTDLFVARESGVYLLLNHAGTFTSQKVSVPFDGKSVPLSIALIDLDGDGHVDMFVATYVPKSKMEGQNIFNKAGYGATSHLLLNNGDNTFKDITRDSGLEYVHNTFQGLFLDLDGDRLPDLVVAHDTGQVRTWKNLGGLKFKNMPNPTSTDYGYPMGIAAGDYDNDGRIDLFFSNTGGTPPDFLAKGDLHDDQVLNQKLRFFHNDGNFHFSDVGAETKTADYEFSWGAVLADFNLDGLQDLVIAENYIGFLPEKLFRLPGRFLVQGADHTFASAEKVAGVTNRFYAISPLVGDFNGDGYPDLIFANLDGPVRAFLNQGGSAHYLKVALKDEPRSIGAVVTVEMVSGKKLTDHFMSGEGLCSDQTHVISFGLGNDAAIARVMVQYLSGFVESVANPRVDSIVAFQGGAPSDPRKNE
jgi:hypothetical protein